MSTGEIGYLALVLSAFAFFVVGVTYAYVSSLQARADRARAKAAERPQPVTATASLPPLRQAA